MDSRKPSNSTGDHAEKTSDVHVCCANFDAKRVELDVIGCCANCDNAGKGGGLCTIEERGDKIQEVIRKETQKDGWTTSMIVALMVHGRRLAAKTGVRSPWSRPRSKES